MLHRALLFRLAQLLWEHRDRKRLSHLKKLCTMPRAQRHNVGKNECMREQQHEVGAMRPWGGGRGATKFDE